MISHEEHARGLTLVTVSDIGSNHRALFMPNQMMLTKTKCPHPDCRYEYYYLSFDVSEETLSKMKNVDPENFYQVDSLYQYKDIVNMSVDTGKIRTICPHCGR